MRGHTTIAAFAAGAALCGCSFGSTPTAPHAITGAQLFEANCAPCHQADARGIEGVYPSLVGSPLLLGEPRALTLWVLRGERPRSLPAARYLAAMPRFGWLKPDAAAALFTYLRGHFGNDAPPIPAAAVADALEQP